MFLPAEAPGRCSDSFSDDVKNVRPAAEAARATGQRAACFADCRGVHQFYCPLPPGTPDPISCADLLRIVHKERSELTHSLILVRIS